MPLDITVVDAFTGRPFSGNPAAVAVLEDFPPEAYMQAVASEMNLAETAFVVPRSDRDHDLRWFTPTTEVDLCGHATLASAHVLGGAARFHTRSGLLVCESRSGGIIEMDFPADDPVSVNAPNDLGLAGIVWFGKGKFDALVVLESAAEVRSHVPDLSRLAALGTRSVIVSAPGDLPGIDCVSRVFGPNVGIAEDPVTGSAHCTLACYWGQRLSKESLVGEQASARSGIVHMRRSGERVILGGQAVTVSRVRIFAESFTGV